MDLGWKVIWANFLLKAGIIKPFQRVSCQRACIPEHGITGGHRRLPTSLKMVSQFLTRFLHPLKITVGWDKVMLMGSSTSNVVVQQGAWRRNKAESPFVSSPSSEKRKAAATWRSKKEHRHQKPVWGNRFQLLKPHVIQSAYILPQSAAQPPLFSATSQSCSTYDASDWAGCVPTYVPKVYRLCRSIILYSQDRIYFYREMSCWRQDNCWVIPTGDTLTPWASLLTCCFVLFEQLFSLLCCTENNNIWPNNS